MIIRLILTLILFAVPGLAQQYAAEFSAGADASTTPHTYGSFAVLAGNGSTSSYTKFMARGPNEGLPRFNYGVLTGIRQNLFKYALGPRRGTVFTDVQGGVTPSADAVSGAVTGGGGVTITLFKAVNLVIGGRASYAPADGGLRPDIQIGIQLRPEVVP